MACDISDTSKIMKILVCEDNPMALKTITFTLVRAGFEVLQASDGEQAIAFTKGLELVRYINTSLSYKIPVIIISGINLKETQEHAMELGARGYLTKPFNPKQLLELVRSEVQH
jgi:DNA-binding response OmpR family regulator